MKRLSIIADTLQKDSSVSKRLRTRGAEVVDSNLMAGHFRISDRCAIVILSAVEFAQWIVRREIFRRVIELKRSIAEPVMIIEGSQPTNGTTPSPSAMRGALAFVAVHNRVPILFADDIDGAADLIYAMANQVQNGMGEKMDATADPDSPAGDGSGKNGKGDTSKIRPCEQIVRLMPEVNPATARALIEQFGSLRGVFSASARDLTKVDGLGPKKAKKIAAFLDGKC